MEQSSVSKWLEQKCEEEHLSLRQAGDKIGLSHSTIDDVKKGSHPSVETIRKLARGFGDGANERLALEDHLLTLAGYRSERSGEPVSEALAQMIDKASQLSQPQLKIMIRFADFLLEIDASHG